MPCRKPAEIHAIVYMQLLIHDERGCAARSAHAQHSYSLSHSSRAAILQMCMHARWPHGALHKINIGVYTFGIVTSTALYMLLLPQPPVGRPRYLA